MKTLHDETRWLSWMDELSLNDYAVIDDFLTDKLFTEIIEYYLATLSKFSNAGIGQPQNTTVRETIRGDHTYWLDQNEDTGIKSFWSLADELLYVFKRYCFLSLSDYEFHFAKYPPGSKYVKHLDQFERDQNRIISVVIYLNESWKTGDGGELEIFTKTNTSFIIEPLARRAVIFKSDTVPHRVLKSNKERYSLTGWLLHKPADLKQLI